MTELPRYAWPGGYTILYLEDRTNDVLCAQCARETLLEGTDLPLTPFVHWEGSLEYCASCNSELESEYGDPEAEESEASNVG